MNADTLRAFFEDRVSAVTLNADLKGAFAQTAGDTFRLQMTDLGADFFVTADHMVKLCDAVLAGALDPEALRAVGFGVIGSDHFHWDPDDSIGARVGETLYDWASPEVNYKLTPHTVAKFRHRLVTGGNTFTHDDLFNGPKHRRDEWIPEVRDAPPA